MGGVTLQHLASALEGNPGLRLLTLIPSDDESAAKIASL